jgi:prepilin peptidase CpaA
VPEVLSLAALVAVTIAVATDLRRRRIPNWLTGGALALGLLGGLWLGGPAGGLSALAGAALGLLILLPFYASGGMGAGDVKLLAAVGALMGPQALLSVTFYGAVVGGLMSLAVLIQHGIVAPAVYHSVASRRWPVLASSIKTPYGVAIAGGVYLALIAPPVW